MKYAYLFAIVVALGSLAGCNQPNNGEVPPAGELPTPYPAQSTAKPTTTTPATTATSPATTTSATPAKVSPITHGTRTPATTDSSARPATASTH